MEKILTLPSNRTDEADSLYNIDICVWHHGRFLPDGAGGESDGMGGFCVGDDGGE